MPNFVTDNIKGLKAIVTDYKRSLIFFRLCYCLNMKCPPQVYALNVWYPAGGIILESGQNFER
jgi:hypothetical protein